MDDDVTTTSNKPICHYEILDVERNADAATIKKAWRIAALQWHPDKNRNSAESTHKFRLIQEAYECLSDPVERKWYDEHRDMILQQGDSGITSNATSSFLFNVMPFQYSGCYNGYHDKDGGFYSVYTDVFHSILEGEQQGWASTSSYSDGKEPIPIFYLLEVQFGNSSSEWKEVSSFYLAWESFSSCLSYPWADLYDTREATNRQMRRLMEDENKKMRRAAKRQRNEEISNLIRFVKKRDPRVQQQRLRVEQLQREREDHRLKIAQEKKVAIQEAKEAWRMQSEKDNAAVEEEDLNAGRIRLADLEDHDDYFYSNRGKGKKKKKGKKNNAGREEEYANEIYSSETNGQNRANISNESAVPLTNTSSCSAENEEYSNVDNTTSSNKALSSSAQMDEFSCEQTIVLDTYNASNVQGSNGADCNAFVEGEESEEEEPELWRCECCRKDFKSRGQMDNHMKSKKHKEMWAKFEKIMAQIEGD
jgi:DnaJ family protein A protein 5